MKRDCLLFSVNVKLFFEFFMMREVANYLCVKLFLEEASNDARGGPIDTHAQVVVSKFYDITNM